MGNLETICKCIKNNTVLNFVKRNLTESYSSNYPFYQKGVQNMLDESFFLLYESQKLKLSVSSLRIATKKIKKLVFKADDDSFWFRSIYKKYKYRKANTDWSRIRKYISGKTILDFGNGQGHLGLQLNNNGYHVLACDILDYRIQEARSIDFVKMISPTLLKYKPKSIDTTLIKSVLHHIDEKNIPTILRKLRMITKRIILGENIYDVPMKYIRGKKQSILSTFVSLATKDQLQTLILTDFFANHISSGRSDINYGLNFKTIDEWNAIFKKAGFSINCVNFIGFDPGKMTRNCHAWMVFD